MTFDATKCFGSPRISQMPWSGSGHFAIAVSTSALMPCQIVWGIWPPLRWCSATESRSIPQTSCCCWSYAPLPMRTGRAPP